MATLWRDEIQQLPRELQDYLHIDPKLVFYAVLKNMSLNWQRIYLEFTDNCCCIVCHEQFFEMIDDHFVLP